MTDPWDLNAQIAQRLFGWAYAARAYSTDPAATALVWQWLERQGAPLDNVSFEYQVMEEEGICCTVQLGRWDREGYGATWPEALCRAALALAEALEEKG